jgi:hypothetical protein
MVPTGFPLDEANFSPLAGRMIGAELEQKADSHVVDEAARYRELHASGCHPAGHRLDGVSRLTRRGDSSR